MLNAMGEFVQWWRSVDFLYEVSAFDDRRQGRAVVSGVLWTGL